MRNNCFHDFIGINVVVIDLLLQFLFPSFLNFSFFILFFCFICIASGLQTAVRSFEFIFFLLFLLLLSLLFDFIHFKKILLVRHLLPI